MKGWYILPGKFVARLAKIGKRINIFSTIIINFVMLYSKTLFGMQLDTIGKIYWYFVSSHDSIIEITAIW